ncbi:MAG: chemotaxis protein CheA [Proteobacteria bacterium]|nr:chemotaxis protein CheA [Pseudomonadota bacterium]
MSDFEAELRKTFLEEAQDLLDAAEAGFIELDAGNHSDAHLNHIFRIAHSFKGSSASVGFKNLSAFAHRLEDLLTKIKTRELEIDRDVCTTLFSALDVFRSYVSGLKNDPMLLINSEHVDTLIQKYIQKCSPNTPTPASQNPGFGFFDEDPIDEIKPNPASAPPPTIHAEAKQSHEGDAIRVSTAKLDALLNSVGELVVNQSILTEHRTLNTMNSEHAASTMRYMGRIINELQDVSMSLRMVPAKPLFQKMTRAVRDVAQVTGKEVNFVCLGEQVELDKILLDKITDPLTHIVRNAVDHGIDSAEERSIRGKPKAARIEMSVLHADDRVIISVTDDGRGLDRHAILKKAREKGLVNAKQELNDDEVYKLIFSPGFSTKEQITQISGRGVGLDVVQKSVEELKGKIHLTTKLGIGTKFQIALPLSFSIIEGMLVEVDERRYIVPIPQLIETVEFSQQRIENSTGVGRIMNFRGEIIPVLSLGEILHGPNAAKRSTILNKRPGLITVSGGRKFSFEVDHILGQQQVVLKKLGHEMREIPGITAGAILPNGDPGLVISLIELATQRSPYAA